MKQTPLISVICSSNRIFLWKELYNSIKESSDNLSFEIIITGPCSPDFDLPSEINYIKTGNIKVPQCNEIALRNAQGKYFLMFGDDQKIHGKGVRQLYKELNDIIYKDGINNIILPNLKVKGRTQRLRYAKKTNTPFASLHSALFDRELLSIVKGIDQNFVGVYWDCDMAMRFQEKGVKIIQSSNVLCQEYTHKKMTYYLHRTCKPYDKIVLNNFWVREHKEDKNISSEDIWCHMSNRKYVLSKKRLKPFIGYEDENILLYSQGPKEVGGLKWE